MEDSIEVMLQKRNSKLLVIEENQVLTIAAGVVFSGIYGLWATFCLPGIKVPFRLKVPFLPSSKEQTENVIKLLEGKRGRLADLGSGDGRLVFAACAAGFQCTGFEINAMLLAYSRGQAFVKQDFWKADLSKYTDVVAFLTPAVISPFRVLFL